MITARTLPTGKEDVWLSYGLLKVLSDKYGTDLKAAQRGADWLVSTGMVTVPAGYVLKAFASRRFGGKLSVVAEPVEGGKYSAAPKMVIEGLPD